MRDATRKEVLGNHDLDRISDPQTEEDYLYKLNLWIRVVMHVATSEYQSGWAGIIEYGTEIDFDEVEKKLTPELLLPISRLVTEICMHFEVAHPITKGAPANFISFREWYEKTTRREGIDIEYPEFIFGRIK